MREETFVEDVPPRLPGITNYADEKLSRSKDRRPGRSRGPGFFLLRCVMNDLIRRRDAVSRMSDLLMMELKGQRLPTWNEVYQAMNDVPSAEPEQRWIPVTEALPNNEEYDWVLGQIRETDSGYLWIPRQVEYREIKDDWYEDSIGWLKENPDHAFEVIAWMPLPKPYGK